MNFRVEQNVDIDGEKRSGTERSFQMVGAANAKERRPEVERMKWTCRLCSSPERVAYVVLGAGRRSAWYDD